MTAITDRIPVAEISRQARQVRFGHTIVALITGTLFAAGFLVAKLFTVLWLALAWVATSVRLGWQQAQTRATMPRLTVQEQADILAENDRLHTEIERLSGG